MRVCVFRDAVVLSLPGATRPNLDEVGTLGGWVCPLGCEEKPLVVVLPVTGFVEAQALSEPWTVPAPHVLKFFLLHICIFTPPPENTKKSRTRICIFVNQSLLAVVIQVSLGIS